MNHHRLFLLFTAAYGNHRLAELVKVVVIEELCEVNGRIGFPVFLHRRNLLNDPLVYVVGP